MTSADGGVRLERDGALATVVLDRPDALNAQTPHTWTRLREIGENLPADVRVVVIRAAGTSFSAGLDRALFSADGLPGLPGISALANSADADDVIAGYQAGFTWLRDPGIVSVAAVQGHAIGAGFQLALACDLRVLADDAKLCMAETGLGVVPDLAGTKPLVDIVGYSRALEICATGRRIAADEAARLGLASLVVPAVELAAATADLVAALLAAPAAALRETKALLLGASDRDHAAQERRERAAQIRSLRTLFGS